MFHICAYNIALPVGSDIDTPALQDDIITIQNNHFILSKPMNLIMAQCYSALMDRAKLASPTMRQIAAPYVRPVQQQSAGTSNPNLAIWNDYPYLLQPFEEIQALLTSNIASSTERAVLAMWLQDQFTPLSTGGWTPLRFTSTGAAVANTWTTVPITFADTIPAGLYQMNVSEHYSATAQFHRWIISNQVWRPGFPSFVATGARHPYAISKGQLGAMGVFRSNDLPRLQVLCTGTDATHTGYLTVTRIGNLS